MALPWLIGAAAVATVAAIAKSISDDEERERARERERERERKEREARERAEREAREDAERRRKEREQARVESARVELNSLATRYNLKIASSHLISAKNILNGQNIEQEKEHFLTELGVSDPDAIQMTELDKERAQIQQLLTQLGG